MRAPLSKVLCCRARALVGLPRAVAVSPARGAAAAVSELKRDAWLSVGCGGGVGGWVGAGNGVVTVGRTAGSGRRDDEPEGPAAKFGITTRDRGRSPSPCRPWRLSGALVTVVDSEPSRARARARDRGWGRLSPGDRRTTKHWQARNHHDDSDDHDGGSSSLMIIIASPKPLTEWPQLSSQVGQPECHAGSDWWRRVGGLAPRTRQRPPPSHLVG